MTSPRLAKLARTPAVVGWVMTLMKPQRASRRSSIAQTVFGSCMSERIPFLHAGATGGGDGDERHLRSTALSLPRSASRRRRCPSSRP
jgi:hypothetical protein